MEDREIVALYWARNEQAIRETENKYARYLLTIARNVLVSAEDGQECVNDTYLRAWNSMPDNRPDSLSAYLGKITRNLAIDVYRKTVTDKRQGSQYALSLEELAEDLPGEMPAAAGSVEDDVMAGELSKAISAFLRGRDPERRNLFISRYFFMDEPKEIAGRTGMNEATVRSTLLRERRALKEYLEREGFAVGVGLRSMPGCCFGR